MSKLEDQLLKTYMTVKQYQDGLPSGELALMLAHTQFLMSALSTSFQQE